MHSSKRQVCDSFCTSAGPLRSQIASAVVVALTLMLATYASHCVWVSSEAYSSPSIVLAARGHDDSKIIFDDFRDSYYWLRYNTAPVSA